MDIFALGRCDLFSWVQFAQFRILLSSNIDDQAVVMGSQTPGKSADAGKPCASRVYGYEPWLLDTGDTTLALVNSAVGAWVTDPS